MSPRLVALALIAAGLSGCSSKPPDDPKTYVARVAADRAAKDAAFQKNADPIPAAKKSELLPLAYFAIDPEYDVPASLKPTDDQTVIQMPTSTGAPRPYRRAGMLEFTLKGQPL